MDEMTTIIKHGIQLTAGFDPASQKQMRATLTRIFAEAGNQIDFDTPENRKDIMALASVFRDMFESVGNKKVDFSKIMGLSSGAAMIEALKGSVKELASVWQDVVGRMGANSLSSIFMKDQSALDGALSRVLTAKGKIKSDFTRSAKAAFVDEKSTDLKYLLQEANANKFEFDTATSWEKRAVAALRYLNVYRRIMDITQDGTNVAKLPPNLEAIFNNLDQIGPYATQKLEEVKAYLQTSVQNIFNLANNRSLLNLTEGGAVNFDVAPRLIKTLDVGDVLGGKKNINVDVVPEIDSGFQEKLSKLWQLAQDQIAAKGTSGFRNVADQYREQFNEIVNMFPEDKMVAISNRLERFVNLKNLTDATMTTAWRDFYNLGQPSGVFGRGGSGAGGGAGGNGDGVGGGLGATSEDVENANKLADILQRVGAAYKELDTLSQDPWNMDNEEEVNRILQERLAIIQRVGAENLKVHNPEEYESIEYVNDLYSRRLDSFAETRDDEIYNQLDENFTYNNEIIEASQNLEVLLAKRRELMAGIYFDAEQEYVEQEQINQAIERRIALMQQLEPLVANGSIPQDQLEEMVFEQGDLDERRNILEGIQQDLFNAEPEGLDDAQFLLDQYERIMVETASGKKLTLGPEMSEADWKAFMKMDTEKAKSIEFVRKAIQQENADLQQQKSIINEVVAAKQGLKASQTKLGVTDGTDAFGESTLNVVKEKQKELKTYLQELMQIEAQEKKNGALTEAEVARRRELVKLIQDMGLAVRYKDGSFYDTRELDGYGSELTEQIEKLNQILSLRKQIALGTYSTGAFGTWADTFSGEGVRDLLVNSAASFDFDIEQFNSSMIGQLVREYQHLHQEMLRCMLVGEEVPQSTIDKLRWFETIDATQLESIMPKLTELQGKIQAIQNKEGFADVFYGKDEAYYDNQIQDLNTLLALQKEYLTLGGPAETGSWDTDLHYTNEQLQEHINQLNVAKRGAQDLARIRQTLAGIDLGAMSGIEGILDRVAMGWTNYDQALSQINQKLELSKNLTSQLEGLGANAEEINVLEENLAKRKEIYNSLRNEGLLTDQITSKYNAINQEILEKIALLQRAQGATVGTEAGIGTSGTGARGTSSPTPAQVIPDGATSAEETELETIRAKVAEVTAAVNTKTQAFFNEQSAVKRVSQSEVHSLGEVTKAVTAVRVALNNLSTKQHKINLSVTGGEDISNISSTETAALQKLRASINLTTKAVDAKTSAFNMEGSTVGKVIGKEISGLMKLKTQVGEVNQQVLDLLKNIQTTKTASGTIVVPKTSTSKTPSQTTTTQGGVNQSDALLDAKVETQFSSLSLLYSQLESTGKLTDVVEKEWIQLWDSLSNVKDPDSLQLWRQQLVQVKNHIQEIAIANKLVADEGKASFQQLVGVTKLYNQMAIGAEKAPTQELRSFYINEANQLLVEQQRLLNGIVMTEGQQTKFDELEAARKREINKITAQMSGAERARQEARASKEQADTVQMLIKLYTEYGALKERAMAVSGTNMASQLSAEADDLLIKIQTLRQSLGQIGPEIQQSFDEALNTGKMSEANKQYRSVAASKDAQDEKERSTIVKELGRDYEKLGQLRAQAYAATGVNEKQFLEEQVRLLEESIGVKQQGLDIDQQLYDTKALDAYNKELEKINLNAAKRRDKDAERAQKQAFKDEIIESQKGAKLTKALSTYDRGMGVLTSAMQMDSIRPEQEAALQRYNEELGKLKTLHDAAKENGVVTPQQQQEIIAQTQHVNTLTAEVQELISNYERLSGTNSDVLPGLPVAAGASSDTIKSALTDAVMLKTQGRASIKGFNHETNELTYTLKDAKGYITSYTAGVRQMDGAMRTVRGSSMKMMGVFESIGRKIKEYSYYFTGSMMIYRAIAWVREGITAIKEIDTALTELKKVTDATEESYEKFLDTAAKTADKVGSTIKEVVSSTADWARLNI